MFLSKTLVKSIQTDKKSQTKDYFVEYKESGNSVIFIQKMSFNLQKLKEQSENEK